MRKTLLFDLDGTLLNTLEDLRDSTNFALRTYGYPERSLEEVRRFVGNGLKMLLTRAVPQGSSEVEIERALACMKAHYCENYHNKTVPYPGIPELLQRCSRRASAWPSSQTRPIRPCSSSARCILTASSTLRSANPLPVPKSPRRIWSSRHCSGSAARRTMRSISATPRSICRLRGIPVSLRHGRLGLPHGGRAARSRGADDLSLAGGARQGAAERQHPVKEAGLLPLVGG